MTKRTRRNIKSTIEEIEQSGKPAEWNIYSESRVITDDMVDERGNTIEEETADPETPDGWELGRVEPTQSPVVTCWNLTPINADEGSG